MKIRKAGVWAAAIVLGMGLASCSQGGTSGGGAASPDDSAAAAACALATAEDPGNAPAPTNVPTAENAPTLEQKDTYTVAFSQNASNNPWRLAETASMQETADSLGYQITVTDANNDQAKQIQDVRSLIAQDPDMLFIAPMTEQMAPVVVEAAEADIPVVLLDRQVDESVAIPGTHFVTVISSDFIQEGKRAAVQMARATGGNAKIIELEGTTGSSPANDRKKGFDEAIAECEGMEIVASQDADFNRNDGQDVTETLLQAHPDVNAIYAHNDEMALGAIAAIKAAGKVPGEDIFVVSIDGSKEAVQAIVDGDLYASVQCNPEFGPAAFDILQRYAAGEAIPVAIINEDIVYTAENAEAELPNAF